jgi:hypothetical protein
MEATIFYLVFWHKKDAKVGAFNASSYDLRNIAFIRAKLSNGIDCSENCAHHISIPLKLNLNSRKFALGRCHIDYACILLLVTHVTSRRKLVGVTQYVFCRLNLPMRQQHPPPVINDRIGAHPSHDSARSIPRALHLHATRLPPTPPSAGPRPALRNTRIGFMCNVRWGVMSN